MSEAMSPRSSSLGDNPDLVCLGRTRWLAAFQRPQQLMTRYARNRRVFFVEEPIFDDTRETRITVDVHDGVHVVALHLPGAFGETESIPAQRAALDQLLARERIA
ncbi:MAG: glycosyltransferase family 1 protein, partial [Vicinamibacteria bacterium]